MSQPAAAQYSGLETPTNLTPRTPMSATAGSRNAAVESKNKTSPNPPSKQPRTDTTAQSIPEDGPVPSSGAKAKIAGSTRRVPSRLPSTIPTPLTKRPTNLHAGSNFWFIKNQYTKKRKDYTTLEKELTEKEKSARELYNELSELREKMIAAGAPDPGQIAGLKCEIGSPVRKLELETTGMSLERTTDETTFPPEKSVDSSELIESLKGQIGKAYQKSQAICQDALEKHTALMAVVRSSWFTDKKDGSQEDVSPEIRAHIELHEKDNEQLKSQLDEAKRAYASLEMEVIKAVSGLHEEYEQYRARCKGFKTPEDLRAREESRDTVDLTVKELQTEREKSRLARDRLRQAEGQLQRANSKLRELHARATADETKIQELHNVLTNNAKNHEAQMKKKEEAIKEMNKSLRTSESLVSKVEKQRDSFELIELKEQMHEMESNAIARMKEISEKLELTQGELDAEKEKRRLAEEALSQLEERYRNLEEKSQEMCEITEQNKNFSVADGSHSDNEMRLFNELQTTRAHLEAYKEKMFQLQQEKEEIIAVMHQAASHVEEEDSKEKLAAELVCKSNELQNLLAEYNELKKVAKNAQERNGILENQLQELQAGINAQIEEGGENASSAYTIELQQQVSDLRNSLVEAITAKVELENLLTQKQLELEQCDRVMRDQSKYLKIRDELLALINGKSQQAAEETSNSEENGEDANQIAIKREALQELYRTVTSKQLQVMRLEKMVKLMEEQQDRAQAQRTRLENRIAQLELSLQKQKEQGSKGFVIL